MFEFLSILCLYRNTIIKASVNLFLLVRISNILAIFNINQYVLHSIEFCHFTFQNDTAVFQPVNKIFQKPQVSFLSNLASIFSAIKHNSSILFVAQTLYTLVKSNLLKCKCLRFSSVRVKICQIPHVNFELTSQFLFKFGIILDCHDTKLSCKF